MHEAEIFIASIFVQERKKEVISIPRKCQKDSEDLQAGVNYYKIYHTKKAKTEDERETILFKKVGTKEDKKNDF